MDRSPARRPPRRQGGPERASRRPPLASVSGRCAGPLLVARLGALHPASLVRSTRRMDRWRERRRNRRNRSQWTRAARLCRRSCFRARIQKLAAPRRSVRACGPARTASSPPVAMKPSTPAARSTASRIRPCRRRCGSSWMMRRRTRRRPILAEYAAKFPYIRDHPPRGPRLPQAGRRGDRRLLRRLQLHQSRRLRLRLQVRPRPRPAAPLLRAPDGAHGKRPPHRHCQRQTLVPRSKATRKSTRSAATKIPSA